MKTFFIFVKILCLLSVFAASVALEAVNESESIRIPGVVKEKPAADSKGNYPFR